MVTRIEYCGVCNEEITPGQPAEFGAPREDEWTGVHLECPSDMRAVDATAVEDNAPTGGLTSWDF